MKLTREELEMLNQTFEYLSDISGVTLEEYKLWNKIKEVLENE